MFRKAIIRTLERTPTAGGLFFTDGLCKKNRRWKKQIGQVPLSMKCAPRNAQKEHWAFGGADAMECTAGRCLLLP